MFSVCELALLALPHSHENVITNGNSFSLYFVLAQEPQTTVIHNPDGNKVFRKNQLHLAFPHHTSHLLFHSKIGPFQGFSKENLILAFINLVSLEPVFICVYFLCMSWLLLSFWISWGGQQQLAEFCGLCSQTLRVWRLSQFSKKCCSLNKTKEHCSQSVVRSYWQVWCAVITLSKDVISVCAIRCFPACWYTVLWCVFCTGLWFSSITSLSSLKTFNISSDKEVLWFLFFLSLSIYMFSSCSFFLCILLFAFWQLIPKMCFVLFFSCMDLKRARKYHHLHITHVPRFLGKSLLFTNFTVYSVNWKNWHFISLVLTTCGYFIWEGLSPSEKILHAGISRAWKCCWCVSCLCIHFLHLPCICPTQSFCFRVTTCSAPQAGTRRHQRACVSTVV